ncbi:MAG: hypothetical protein Q8J68_12895 [Methanolobus sp.]|uniref:hypothetical protein n=1 Tax=Methanolobus sp. TaxID=1874737 RepID=UPI0027309816|nr:hypothetical protein [Methanolobus sp.]MDP2218170.1 hypothetical protein [Methanolobus sp.]
MTSKNNLIEQLEKIGVIGLAISTLLYLCSYNVVLYRYYSQIVCGSYPYLRKCNMSEENDITNHIRTAVEQIMENEDPVEYILNEHQKLHIGDKEIAKTLLVSIGVQSALNSEGIQPKVNGASGKGKTHCCKAMKHLMPPEWIIETMLSDKVIYRMQLNSGVVIFCDDADLSPSLEGTIKRATTNFQAETIFTTLDKEHKVKSLPIPPHIVWWLTSIDDDQSLQLLNRQLSAGVDETPDQDRRVLEHQIDQALTGKMAFPETEEVRICREIIRTIKQKEFVVKIPFAKDIEWTNESNRRNFPLFCDIMAGFAIFRFKQRKLDETGALLADLKDFISAAELYNKRAKNQQLKITNKEEELLAAIKELNGRATYEDLCKKLRVGSSRISHLLNGKGGNHDSGLLYKVPGLSTEQDGKKTMVIFDGSYEEGNYEVKLRGV